MQCTELGQLLTDSKLKTVANHTIIPGFPATSFFQLRSGSGKVPERSGLAFIHSFLSGGTQGSKGPTLEFC